MKLKVIFRREDDGGYSVVVPGLPGCVSEGNTLEEARANIREAVEGVFAVMQDHAEVDPYFETQAHTEEIDL